jgi:hypothetical protein
VTQSFLELIRYHGFPEDEKAYGAIPQGEMCIETRGSIGNRYLIRFDIFNADTVIELNLEPGLCNIVFYSSDCKVVGRYDWLVAGGLTEIPVSFDKTVSADHLTVDNMCLV